MGNSSESGNADLKPEATRAGGPDDARTAGERVDTNPIPDDARAGGPDDARGTDDLAGASREERDNVPRGAPVDSRSATR
jgi:hypothetical protein